MITKNALWVTLYTLWQFLDRDKRIELQSDPKGVFSVSQSFPLATASSLFLFAGKIYYTKLPCEYQLFFAISANISSPPKSGSSASRLIQIVSKPQPGQRICLWRRLFLIAHSCHRLYPVGHGVWLCLFGQFDSLAISYHPISRRYSLSVGSSGFISSGTSTPANHL